MKRVILAAAALIAVGTAYAKPKAPADKPTLAKQEEPFRLIHVADLEKDLTAQTGHIFIFDANNEKTRTKNGVIPGATLLSSSTQYDAQKTLPSDKTAEVVFYCANTGCMASHEAAKIAILAGYSNVAVMMDGIEGWKKAGKKTDKSKGT